MEIKEVIITLRQPSGRKGDYGLVALGNDTLEGNILTMVDEDGKPLREKHGIMRRTLEPGEDAAAVARKLTRDIHIRQADSNDFNRRLEYPPIGWA
jgi:hypothetical protein